LEKGPAYPPSLARAVVPRPQAPGAVLESEDDTWSTLRGDVARSGSTAGIVPTQLKRAWKTKIDGRLTSPVAALGKVFVASIDNHTVYAIDVKTGEIAWTYTTGARVDSPPTVYGENVYFGSADGYVYAIRAQDGTLAWRFRAAPADRRMVAYNQLESTWPVHGSVLIHKDVLYCTAGRNIFLDGGIRLIRLDPETGRLLGETVMDSDDPNLGGNIQQHVRSLNMPVANSDVLSASGDHLFMRSQKFTLDGQRLEIPVGDVHDQPASDAHLFCQIGFLDDTWFHRSYWTYGRRVTGGYGGWPLAGRVVPSGRILAYDDERVYGFGRNPEYYTNASVLEYHLFGADKHVTDDAIRRLGAVEKEINARSNKRNANSSDWKARRGYPIEDQTAVRFNWRIWQPSVQVRAMAVTKDALFVAGHPDLVDERQAYRLPDDPDVLLALARQADALGGEYGGQLWAVSKTDGAPIARYLLDSAPTFDGMAAAYESLFVTTLDGFVVRLTADGATPLPALRPEDPLQIISDEPQEPNYLRPLPVDKSSDFDVLRRAQAFEAPLGYRVASPSTNQQPGWVMKKLDDPLTGKFTITTRAKFTTDLPNFNAYLAIGAKPNQHAIVTGIRQKAEMLQVVQPAPNKTEPVTKGTPATWPADRIVELTLHVDLDKQTAVLEAADTKLEFELLQPIESITHVGYATENAATDYSPVMIEKK